MPLLGNNAMMLSRPSRFLAPRSHGFPSIFSRFITSGPPCRLFVGGLSPQIDEELLKDAFASFGKVLDAKVIMDRETGRSKGYGFISFASSKDADAAIKVMDGRDLNGKVLRVNFAVDNRG